MSEYHLKELCLEITNKCPNTCIHCSNNDIYTRTLNLSEIKQIIFEFTGLGGKILEISGGEPLTHPDLLEIVKYAKENNLITYLYTSGVVSESENTHEAEDIIEKLSCDGLDKIFFNLEGANAETHEKIMLTDKSFEKVISGIKAAKQYGLCVGVHFVPMKLNIKELKETIQLCSKLGVDEFAILRLVPQGRAYTNRKEIQLNDYCDLINKIPELDNLFKGELRIGCPLDFYFLIDDTDSPCECHAAKSSCLIKPDGDVVPCPAFKQNPHYIGGNIKHNGLKEIWLNSWEELREFDYRKLNGKCADCEYLSKCKGRCIAQRILAHGSIYNGPDVACPLAHKLQDKYAISTKEVNPSNLEHQGLTRSIQLSPDLVQLLELVG